LFVLSDKPYSQLGILAILLGIWRKLVAPQRPPALSKRAKVTAKRSTSKSRNAAANDNPPSNSASSKKAQSRLRSLSTVAQVTAQNVKAISDLEHSLEDNRTRGEKLADVFASVVGSWNFIIIQSAILCMWVALNLVAWSYKWDPYPFILLNLALSFQAAFASPIIMMSQNPQSQVAERRNRLDLQINLLSEQENTEMLLMLRKLCEANNIDVSQMACAALEQHTSAAQMLQQIETAEKAALKTAVPQPSPNGKGKPAK
jgi:uncharacterized membrane protein